MPFNPNYEIPAGTLKPAVVGTPISAADWNAFITDLQTALTDTIRASTTAFTGVVELPDGSAGTPALTFTTDLDTGLFRKGANQFGITAGGSEHLLVTATGADVTGILAATGDLDIGGDAQIDGNLTVTGTITNAGGVIASAKAFILIDTAGACILYGARNVASATWYTSGLSVTFTTPMPDAFFFASATQYGNYGPGLEFNTIVAVLAAGGVTFQKDVEGTPTDWAVGEYVQVFATA
jgi:hypothetical protein